MSLVGADVAALRSLAAAVESQADILEVRIVTSDAALATVDWNGPDADEFEALWHTELRPNLTAAIEFLIDAAKTLLRNAEQQEKTSEADDGGATSRVKDDGGTTSWLESVEQTAKRLALRIAAKKIANVLNPWNNDDSKKPPTVVSTTTETSGLEGSYGFVGLSDGTTVIIDELSDDTYKVTVLGEAGVGVGALTPGIDLSGLGVDLDSIFENEGGLTLDDEVRTGAEFTFDPKEDVERFTQWVQKQETVGDIGENLLPGPAAIVGDLAFRTVAAAGDLVGGHAPPAPTAVILEGGPDHPQHRRRRPHHSHEDHVRRVILESPHTRHSSPWQSERVHDNPLRDLRNPFRRVRRSRSRARAPKPRVAQGSSPQTRHEGCSRVHVDAGRVPRATRGSMPSLDGSHPLLIRRGVQRQRVGKRSISSERTHRY